jgi:SAM-dependent methyltransferase
MPNWFENEALWRALYPFLFSEQRMATADRHVDDLLQLAGRPVATALDLACGPGSHSVALARRGITVTGVDASPYLLGQARQRAAAANVEVEWIEADMRAFERPSAFDLALNLFTSFGYFEDESDDRLVLQRLYGSLRPAGALVMDMLGKEHLARLYEPTTSEEAEDGTVLVRRTEIEQSWSWATTECTVLRGKEIERFTYGHRLFSARELALLLAEAGFEDAHFHGDSEGGAYGPDAERLIAVAYKPAA